MTNQERLAMEARDKEVAGQIDGHYCVEWDGLSVSAWTVEYDCCQCRGFKSRLGKFINWFVMKRFHWTDPNCRWWQI